MTEQEWQDLGRDSDARIMKYREERAQLENELLRAQIKETLCRADSYSRDKEKT